MNISSEKVFKINLISLNRNFPFAQLIFKEKFKKESQLWKATWGYICLTLKNISNLFYDNFQEML